MISWTDRLSGQGSGAAAKPLALRASVGRTIRPSDHQLGGGQAWWYMSLVFALYVQSTNRSRTPIYRYTGILGIRALLHRVGYDHSMTMVRTDIVIYALLAALLYRCKHTTRLCDTLRLYTYIWLCTLCILKLSRSCSPDDGVWTQSEAREAKGTMTFRARPQIHTTTRSTSPRHLSPCHIAVYPFYLTSNGHPDGYIQPAAYYSSITASRCPTFKYFSPFIEPKNNNCPESTRSDRIPISPIGYIHSGERLALTTIIESTISRSV